jgi:hypothetical protein
MYRLSLTSIPPRHRHLPRFVKRLLLQSDAVYVCIPKKYNKYPEPFAFPEPRDPRIKVVRPELDYGPATKFLACPREGISCIIYVDDDTEYPETLVKSLLAAHAKDPDAVWGLSGFTIDEYRTQTIKNHHGRCVDVIEGFGGVLIPTKVLDAHFDEIVRNLGPNDDIALSKVLERYGVPRRVVCTEDCHIGLVQQFNLGNNLFDFESSRQNNLKLLDGFL